MSGVTPDEQSIYNTITKRFISVFYPDCTVSNTTVLGHVDKVEFKATGKQIIHPGWRDVYASDKKDNTKDKEELMPSFKKGETGTHNPQLQEKTTSPPKYYTEATLLRGMESAGKNVEDEDLRDAMKDNGIGRPSTRANIIETLFRRRYIERRKKNLHATATGVDLIGLIKSDLLKSAELTGQWERKIKLIEKGEYDINEFKKELIEMIVEITNNVKFAENKTIAAAETEKTKEKKKREPKKVIPIEEMNCPKCKTGNLLKGKSAYGCSNFQNGCKTIIPFVFMGKKLTTKQLSDLILKGKTTKIKGFITLEDSTKRDGKVSFNNDFKVILEN